MVLNTLASFEVYDSLIIFVIKSANEQGGQFQFLTFNISHSRMYLIISLVCKDGVSAKTFFKQGTLVA